MKTQLKLVLAGMVIAMVLPSTGNAGTATGTQKADALTPRWSHSAAVVNGRNYLIGGNQHPNQLWKGGVRKCEDVAAKRQESRVK